MHIVVLIKQVPATDNVKMDPETGTMIRSGRDSIINPLDENALTAALQLRHEYPGSRVTVITMGPDSARKSLQEALALGADQAILLSHRTLAGADTIATARVLAAAIKKCGNVHLILCGERATDGETGQTGPMVAAMLDLPAITYARKINLIKSNSNGSAGDIPAFIRVERLVEGGYEEVEAPLPALVAVIKEINQPGFPTLRGKLRARTLPLLTWTPDDLELKPEEVGLKGSPTRVVKIFSPKLSRNAVIYQHDPEGKAVRALVEFLQQREVLN